VLRGPGERLLRSWFTDATLGLEMFHCSEEALYLLHQGIALLDRLGGKLQK